LCCGGNWRSPSTRSERTSASRPNGSGRTSPSLGLFSLITLLAHHLVPTQTVPARRAAWYAKSTPTFLDAIAVVRLHLWTQVTFCTSTGEAEMVKIPRSLLDHWSELLCYVA
jgi:hypothetical protein